MPVFLRIDIEEELAAIERGECPLCRIGARHPYPDSDCPQAPFWAFFWDTHMACRDIGVNPNEHLSETILKDLFAKGATPVEIAGGLKEQLAS